LRRAVRLFACLFAAFVVFFFAASTPPPVNKDAPAAMFSAGRAIEDIAVLGAAPHPVGSARIAQVRAYLLARMSRMGLHPLTQVADSLITRKVSGATYVSGASVTNLIGVLPGRDRAAPALALMAHYDSVPGSPGVADDSAGAASALEILRAIAVHGQPDRDVILILTDGEELGLLGAKAFFAEAPLARHVGFVINLEARGGGGRAAMFQTGERNGADVALFASHARTPDTTSLLPFVYHYLPNDTDFTVSLAKGIPGYNIAFIGRQFDYHSPSSTVAALDKGAVQHMGSEALGPALAIAFAPSLPPRAPDQVFGDILGVAVIHYQPVWGWLILTLSAALILFAARRAPISYASAGIGALAGLAILVLDGLLLFVARQVTGAGEGGFEYRPILARFPMFEAAMALVALGGILGVAALAGRKDRASGAWIGLLLFGMVVGFAAQAVAPLAAFLITWPLLAASVCALVTGAGTAKGRGAWIVYGVMAVIALAWVGNFLHFMLEGLDLAPVCALFAWLAAMNLWPLAAPSREGGRRATLTALIPAAACLVVGLGLAIWMRETSPWSARYPRAVAPEIVADGDKVWRAGLPPLDNWTRDFLGPGAMTTLTDVPGQPNLIARPSPGIAVAAVPVSLTPALGRGETFTIKFDGAARAVAMDVKANASLAAIRLNGRLALQTVPAGAVTHLRWRVVAGAPLAVTLLGAKPGLVTIRYAVSEAGWPIGAAPIPPLPADHMAWGDPPPKTIMVGAVSGPL
jgi:hypothetical protein